SDGKQQTINDGPLLRLLKSKTEKVLIVVNWSNFTPAQQASYQSLIDAVPMLSVGSQTIKLSKNVIIFGIISNAEAAGRAFISRSKRWQLHDDFFVDTIPRLRYDQLEVVIDGVANASKQDDQYPDQN